jgi:hypothetical protein
MQPRIPELNKKAGVCYAITDDGIELPIIDVTHPAFAIKLNDKELEDILQIHLKDVKNQERTPEFLRRIMIRIMLRNSFLMRGIAASAGTFMSGINTYILKIGPDNLNAGYATDLDRRLAAALPVLSIRLRLQDLAHLLADGLTPALDANKQATLHMLNIGGGPAIDSLNALIVLQKERPGLLNRRQIFIHVLDLEDAGPNFGLRAVTSLTTELAPLHGLEIHFDHLKYDWSDTTILSELLRSFDANGILLAASSEGALFEYGSDEEIIANLRMINKASPPDAIVVGTVTRADEIGGQLNRTSRAAINFRGIDAFSALALRAGWKLTKRLDRPLSHDILMKKA